ncbi:MAG: hypothetical protein ABSD38_11970 [Syntrophorhabdales bacterium]
MFNGYEKWPVNVKKCTRHSGIARPAAIWTDDLLGDGKPHPEDKWWPGLKGRERGRGGAQKSALKKPWIVDNEWSRARRMRA